MPLSPPYYTVRSQINGNYLVAHPDPDQPGYLLVFPEHFDALSYLNTHGGEAGDRFAVEALPTQQLQAVLQRWQLEGIGLVQDPLIPTIEFLTVA